MAFKEVLDLNTDTVLTIGGVDKTTKKQNPKVIEGYFLGSKKFEDKKSKSGFSYIHVFQTANGNVGVWGKTELTRKMLNSPVGTMIRVTSTGMRPTNNGDMYTYKVEIDNENTIDVGEVPVKETYTGTEEDSYQDDSDTEESFDDEESSRFDQPTKAAQTKENHARVQAILSKGKNRVS